LLFTGGLSAVIWTDFVQVIIMIIGALILMTISELTCAVVTWELSLFN